MMISVVCEMSVGVCECVGVEGEDNSKRCPKKKIK